MQSRASIQVPSHLHMTLLRRCPQAEPRLVPISAKLKEVTMVEAELTLRAGDQDTERAHLCLEEGKSLKMHSVVLTYFVCCLVCSLLCFWCLAHRIHSILTC